MKKYSKLTALILSVIMIFAGWAQADYKTIIKSDGSGTVAETIEIEKTAADAYVKKNVDGYTDFESYIKDIIVLMQMSGQTTGSYEKVTKDDGKEYYRLMSKDNLSSKNLSKSLTEALGMGDAYATKDTVYMVIKSEYVTMPDDAIADMGISKEAANSMSFTYSFEFSSDVVSTTGTVDKTNKKVVTFNVPLNKTTTIFATTNSANNLTKTKAVVKKLNSIKPTAVKSLKVKSVKKKKGTVVLKLKKIKGVKYCIEYSTKKKFPPKYTDYKFTKKTTVAIKNLKAGKKYYFRVKSYKTNYAGTDIYSKGVRKSIKISKK